jgi:hypothetical protein
MELHHSSGDVLRFFFPYEKQLNPCNQNAVVQTDEEHHQAYRVSWNEAQSRFIHTSDLLIFRGETPPQFIVDVGKSSLLTS